MANIKSAQKRIDTIERRNQENRFVRATLSTKVKKLRKMIEEGKIAEAETFSKEVKIVNKERVYNKEEPKRNFRTEKYSNQNLKIQWISSTAEWRF